MGPQCGGCFSVLVRREIVADHNGPRFDLRHQNFTDVSGERCSIHCTLDDPGRDQLIMGQTRNEGLGSPGPKGSGGVEPRSAFGSPAQAGHVRFDAGLIDEDHTVWGLRYGW